MVENQKQRAYESLGLTAEQIEESKSFESREGFLKYVEKKKLNSNKVLPTKGKTPGEAFELNDDSYLRTCSVTGPEGDSLRQRLVSKSGILIPMYIMGADGTYKVDWQLTERFHKLFSQDLRVNLAPLAETRRFNDALEKYVAALAVRDGKKDRESMGSGSAVGGVNAFGLIAHSLGEVGKATTAEIYRSPFNTNEYSEGVISQFKNFGFFVDPGDMKTALWAVYRRKKLVATYDGLTDEKLQAAERASMDVDLEYKNAPADAAYDAGLAKRINAQARAMKASYRVTFETVEELSSLSTTPGLKLTYGLECMMLSIKDNLENIAENAKSQKEIKDLQGGMALSFLTSGYKDLAEKVSSAADKSGQEAYRRKAKDSLNAARKKIEEARAEQLRVFNEELPRLVLTAFPQLKISGYIQSTRIK